MGDQLNDQKMTKRMRTSSSGASVIFTLAFLFVSLGVALCAGSAFAAQPLDVVFVLDNSGSMKQNDPEFLTRRAVANFADALAAESKLEGRLAIVLFDGQASLVQRLTPAGDLASTRLLSDALEELDFSGQRTNSPSGIERALYELRERGRADAEQAIIFLSDGKIDTGDSANDIELARWLREDLAGESAASHVRIFGIAFTENADYQLMQALARRTKGRYYRAFAAGELATVVDDVLAKVAAPQLAGRNGFEPGFTDDERNAVAAKSPDIAAAAFLNRENEEAGGLGLLALLPVVFLVVGGALFYRRQGRNWGASVRSPATLDAPPAQLLDIGGHAGTSGQAFALEPGCTTIGRDANNSIVLRDDTISSEHALIENCDGRYWLQDLRSTNGTCLADKRLDPDERVPLKSGDHVRFADIDLMFVVKGYVPGGATVYLSSSTAPPADWSMIGASKAPGIPVAVHEKKVAPPKDGVIGDESSGDEPTSGVHSSSEVKTPIDASLYAFLDASIDASIDASLDEIAFAEERARLDPASVVDLDEKLGAAATDEDSASLGEPKGGPSNISLTAAAVELNPESLRRVLEYHLSRVSEISSPFAGFINRAFEEELRDALSVAACELIQSAQKTGVIGQREYTVDRVRYLICGVPGAMATAQSLFIKGSGGFTRVLTEQLQSESFKTDRCEILAILTFGFDADPWVSLSIIPDDGQDPRIDLLSSEFLTETERREIEPNIDSEISQSGLA